MKQLKEITASDINPKKDMGSLPNPSDWRLKKGNAGSTLKEPNQDGVAGSTGYTPKAGDEGKFAAFHKVKDNDDRLGNNDKYWKGNSVKTFDRASKRMGYNSGEDSQTKGEFAANKTPPDRKSTGAVNPASAAKETPIPVTIVKNNEETMNEEDLFFEDYCNDVADLIKKIVKPEDRQKWASAHAHVMKSLNRKFDPAKFHAIVGTDAMLTRISPFGEELEEGKSKDSDDNRAKWQKFKDRKNQGKAKVASKDPENEEVATEKSASELIISFINTSNGESRKKRIGQALEAYYSQEEVQHEPKSEEEEVITELSGDKKKAYINAARTDVKTSDHMAKKFLSGSFADRAAKRRAGIQKARS